MFFVVFRFQVERAVHLTGRMPFDCRSAWDWRRFAEFGKFDPFIHSFLIVYLRCCDYVLSCNASRSRFFWVFKKKGDAADREGERFLSLLLETIWGCVKTKTGSWQMPQDNRQMVFVFLAFKRRAKVKERGRERERGPIYLSGFVSSSQRGGPSPRESLLTNDP